MQKYRVFQGESDKETIVTKFAWGGEREEWENIQQLAQLHLMSLVSTQLLIGELKRCMYVMYVMYVCMYLSVRGCAVLWRRWDIVLNAK